MTQDWIEDHRMASLEDKEFNIQNSDQFCSIWDGALIPWDNFSWYFF